jgi:exodeoxyribonuclease VII small subunit
MPKHNSLPPAESLPYEEALAELEKVVASLESESGSLDEALALYERGQALARRCSELLDKAELKILQLSGNQLNDAELEN